MTFPISDQEKSFRARLALPLPTLSPLERCRRRFAFRNERNLYKAKSTLSGKEIMTCYHPSENLKIYEHDEWWSDQWEALSYARDYDFNKPFFQQFAELQKEVPVVALHGNNNQNCQYVNYPAECKNCYMIFGSVYSEDCLYGNPYSCKNCVDSLLLRDSELCYQCVTSEKCYQCFFCQNCVNSRDLISCFDCHGCSNCIGCTGLRNKQYHVFNQKYSKADFENFKKDLDLCDSEKFSQLLKSFQELKTQLPHRAMVSVNAENCTGDYIYESKNTNDSYDVQRCWDCAYLAQTIDMKDCYDCNYTEENELCCEYIAYYRNNNCQFDIGLFNSYNAKYCAYCMSCKNIFGCIGLRNKEYCILNKQYSKENYEALLPKIIAHMKETKEYGEFFPIAISPFCYNETVAQEYFPLTKEEALSRGYRWREKDPKEYKAQTFNVPKNITEVPETIINETLACVSCGKNFRIQAAELRFYKMMKLPIPTLCPDCRHAARLALRNPRQLHDRVCAKCNKAIKTTYSPERQETVYCEECYMQDLY